MGTVLAAATAPDLATFVVSAAIVLLGAVGVILARNPVHSALMLVATLFGVAVLFVAQQAHFLAAVQVIVYAGAIVVLFLFVIMFLGVDRSDDVRHDELRGQRPAALAIGVLSLAGVLVLGGGLTASRWATGRRGSPAITEGSNVERLAETIFTRYLFAFEVTSVLLVIAVVGAVVLARRSRAVADDEDVDAGVAAR